MTKYFVFLLFIFLYINKSFSQDIINEFDIIFKNNEFDDKIKSEFIYSTNFFNIFGLFDISTSNSDLNIKSIQIDAESNSWGSYIRNCSFVVFSLITTDHFLSILDKGKGDSFNGNIVFDATSVIVNDQTLILEQKYLDGYVRRPDLYAGNTNEKFYIEKSIISNNKKWIGGTVQWSDNTDYHHIYLTYTINIWRVEDGKLIYSVMPDNHDNSVNYTIDIRFLLNDRYLFVRQSWVPNERMSFPSANMLDLETYEFIPVNSDLALTSDEKYYVTERDGLPSLVETTTHEVIQRYDPGSPMTACCFSPDDRTLYIACEDLQIYAFDSHLPLDTRAWELY